LALSDVATRFPRGQVGLAGEDLLHGSQKGVVVVEEGLVEGQVVWVGQSAGGGHAGVEQLPGVVLGLLRLLPIAGVLAAELLDDGAGEGVRLLLVAEVLSVLEVGLLLGLLVGGLLEGLLVAEGVLELGL